MNAIKKYFGLIWLILAADGEVAAGLLIQRLPVKGQDNLEGSESRSADEDEIGVNEDYNRIAMLAATLKRFGVATIQSPIDCSISSSTSYVWNRIWRMRRSGPEESQV